MRLLALSATGTLGLATLLATASPAAEFDSTHSFAAESLVLSNLIGEVTLRGHEGSSYEVRVQVRGADAGPELVQVDVEEGRVALVDVVFPRDEREYVYPALGGSSSTIYRRQEAAHRESWIRRFFSSVGGDGIRVSGSGSGVEIWADVEILVPQNGSVRVQHGVGNLAARDLESDVILETESGSVEAGDIVGDVRIDTGAGAIRLEAVHGEVSCDTGSGQVDLARIDGPLLHVDTGSGGVELREIVCEELHVDTGSGGVRGYALSADRALVDTGSGRVSLEFASIGKGEFVVDTGSGGIDLLLPDGASADILAETGSGGIDLDLPQSDVRRKERNVAEIRLGSGDAEVRLDSGSGGITIGLVEGS